LFDSGAGQNSSRTKLLQNKTPPGQNSSRAKLLPDKTPSLDI